MKEYSEIIKRQDQRREDEKNQRLNKIDQIAGRFKQTVDKELIERIKQEEVRIAKDQKRQNEKFDKEQERKQKSLERK